MKDFIKLCLTNWTQILILNNFPYICFYFKSGNKSKSCGKNYCPAYLVSEVIDFFICGVLFNSYFVYIYIKPKFCSTYINKKTHKDTLNEKKLIFLSSIILYLFRLSFQNCEIGLIFNSQLSQNVHQIYSCNLGVRAKITADFISSTTHPPFY